MRPINTAGMPRRRPRNDFEEYKSNHRSYEFIDISNNNLLEQGLKASLDGAGLEEAKTESRALAGDELYEQVAEQLPGLTNQARQTLLLITGLDDIINHERVSPASIKLSELLRLQSSLQNSLDKGEDPIADDMESAFAFIEGYDTSQIPGSVYRRVECEIWRLQAEEMELEEMQRKEEEAAIQESIDMATIQESFNQATLIPELNTNEESKTVGGGLIPVPQTAEERRKARMAALDRLEQKMKAQTLDL